MEGKPSTHTVINRLSVGPVTHIRISGVIDETFNALSFARDLVGHVILDLGRVERISSFGVRRWIEFTGRMPVGASSLSIVNAPPLVVDQLNMVEGFAGVTQVLSVLAPYTCPRCGEDRMRLVDLRTEAAIIAEGKAPSHTCPVCKSPLQFADLPSEFFDYARRQRLGTIELAVARYLKTLQPSAASESVESSGHVKLVHEDITFFRIASMLKGDLNVRRLAAGLEGRVVYDFGNVTGVEPEAGNRLIQVFDTASETAKVILWRVPPVVLNALAQTGRPVHAGLSTLYLPCDCRNCGSKTYQRIGAGQYVQALSAGTLGEVPCNVCGGRARVPELVELEGFLKSVNRVEAALEDLEALEPRALSQYLAGAAAHEGSGEHPQADSGNFGSSLRLQILRRIGQGGMAEVFLARQVGLKGFEKYVVVKKILENFAQQADFVEMLFAEARANARLTHQNIVQTYDVGMMNGVAYITMEYVRGPDVKRLMTLMRKAGEKVPIQHALRIIAEIAAGLHYAHSYVDPTGTRHPMVHRDVSPHNILLSLDGAIKLSDFGIAKVQGEAENTRPGTFKGKIAYLSPEAIAGMAVDARSDVFALGVSLYELLTGRLPFRRENEAATLHAIMREPPQRPSKFDPEMPEDLSDLAILALEKDPAARIQSAGEFRERIESLMQVHHLSSSPTSVAQFFLEKLGPQLSEYAPSGPSGGNVTPVNRGSPPAATPSKRNKPPDIRNRDKPEVVEEVLEVAHEHATPDRPREPRPAKSPPMPKAPPPVPRDATPRVPGEARSLRPPPPTLHAEAPPAPESSKRPAGNGQRRPVGRKPWLIGGLLGALVIAVAGVVLFNRSSDRIPVTHLGPGEHPYVSGWRVDPEDLRVRGTAPVLVSIAGPSGLIQRLGTLVPDAPELDVHGLVDVTGSSTGGSPPSPKEVAKLFVHASLAKCPITLGGEPLVGGRDPATVRAGRELEVTVACPGRPAWTRWAMAAPGQEIHLDALEPTP